VQNRSGLYWTLEAVNQQLKEKIVKETEQIWAISQTLAISMRTAAYVHALNRLEKPSTPKVRETTTLTVEFTGSK
jgi:glutamate dehydrogenase (NADP+)